MATAVVQKEKAALPLTVDEHPAVRRHTKQVADLQDKLRAAQARGAALVAERTQLHRAQHEANVACALGDAAGVVGDLGRVSRLAHIDGEIEHARTEAATLSDAVDRLTTILASVREDAHRDMTHQCAAAADAVIMKMHPHVEELLVLSQQLATIAARVPYGSIFVPPQPLLMMWIDSVAAARGVR